MSAKPEKSMSATCFLDTDGYRISFTLNAGQASQACLDLIVELMLDKHLGDVVVTAVPILIDVRDLSRLVDYFDEHVAQLLQNPDHESYTFVPIGLGFQVQALAGDVQEGNDGEFTVRFLLHVGQSEAEGHRVYMGGESVVSLKNITRFTSSLHDALSAAASWHTESKSHSIPIWKR